MGGNPGIVPGQIERGKSSLLAGAPNNTGGTLMKLSSSLGNLKPASLNALPKSFNFGKSIWQVLQDVPYWRENAGIAWLVSENATTTSTLNTTTNNPRCLSILRLLLTYEIRWVTANLTHSVGGILGDRLAG